MKDQPKEEYRRLGEMLAQDENIPWDKKHDLIHKCVEVIMCDLPDDEFWKIHREVQEEVYNRLNIIL